MVDKVMLAAATSGSSGPDLGFLRLPEVNVENLRATNSFCSISDRRGGGLWRIYFEPDGSNKVHERRLIGVAFYEIPHAEGNKRINCHGPRSVYNHLVETIRTK